MVIDAEKTINELEGLRRSNYDDIDQLNKLLASTHQRLSKIYEYAEIEELLILRHLAENSLRDIQAAIHGFEETDAVLEKIIDKYLAFMKVKFD